MMKKDSVFEGSGKAQRAGRKKAKAKENVAVQQHSSIKPVESGRAGQDGRKTILVIYPDEVFINQCRHLLERQGFEIDFALDGAEGVQKAYRTVPDLVLAACSAPEINGYQISRLLKHDPVMRKIPLLLIADSGQKMNRFWAMKAGADEVVDRHDLNAQLASKVNLLLDLYESMDSEDKLLLRASNEKNPFNIRTRLNQILDTALVESMLMVEFRSFADLVHETAVLNYMLFGLLESVLEYDAAAIFYNDASRGARQLTIHLPDGKLQSSAGIEQMKGNFFERLTTRGLILSASEPVGCEVIGAVEEGVASMTQYSTVYFREVRTEAGLIGAMAFYVCKKLDYSKIFPTLLVENEVRLLMKLRHLYSQSENLAVSDSLTGLSNHRQLMTTLQREFSAAKRYQQPLSLALLTIQDFRYLNDTWGHSVGDDMMAFLAGLLRDSFREVDVLARFSGHRFAVLMPQTGQEQAMRALARFEALVAQRPFVMKEASVSLSVRYGLASMAESVETTADLVRLAENALKRVNA